MNDTRYSSDTHHGEDLIVRSSSCFYSYRRNTAIIETFLTDKSGAEIRIIDYMPRFLHYDRPFRPPMLVRHISPVSGSPRIRIRLRPRFNYGAEGPEIFLGSNHLRYHTPKMSLRLETDAPVAYLAEELPFVLEAPVNLIFGQDEDFDAPLTETAQRYLINTEAYWKDWVRDLSIPFEWQEAVI